MVSSPPARLCYLLLLVVVLLLATPTLSSPSVRASFLERRRRRVEEDNKPAALPPAVVVPVPVPVPGRARQEFHVAPTTTGPIRSSRRSRPRGGGTGAWTFSAMLPRGFVPPSGSSACHDDMPDAAADVQLFPCSGATGTP